MEKEVAMGAVVAKTTEAARVSIPPPLLIIESSSKPSNVCRIAPTKKTKSWRKASEKGSREEEEGTR